MINKDTYFTDYEAYTENDIVEITHQGISLKMGKFIDFLQCADTFMKTHSANESMCVGGRDITDNSFTFYTLPKPTMIKFIEKGKFAELIARKNTRQRFYELQKKINELGYKTFDIS